MTRMSKPWAVLAPLLLGAAVLVAGDASASDTSLSLGEIASPPAAMDVDVASFKTAAEGALKTVDTTHLHKHRNVLVSVAIIAARGSSAAFTVNALLRDAKTGVMLAIIEGKASATGSTSAEVRKQTLHAALRNAVRQIPVALASN